MKKILVVNVNWLGDVIFSSPVFHALKKKFPDAKVTCMVVPRVVEIVQCLDGVDDILVYDEKGRDRWLWGKFKLIQKLKRERFDTAFVLSRSKSRVMLLKFAGIPQIIGYDEKGRSKYFTHNISLPDKTLHRSDHYLNIIESFGIPVVDRTNKISIDDESLMYADLLLKQNAIADKKIRVMINPGGNWDLKRWPKESFTLLIDELLNEGRYEVIVAGSSSDVELVNAIIKPLSRMPIVLTGKTSLKQLIAVMSKMNVVVSADSGPLHLANAVGVDVVGIFGPTRKEITAPRGQGKKIILQHNVGCNHSACYHLSCRDNVCMQAVTVKEVLHAVRQIKS